ncbi:MAG: hydrogenase nickel incorporation protein HypB [Zoogloeaceae bacterium]|jgi:hydrogenase nickel incorporation protein HypB|nr:hydrogenase nickel incorporation protein HypB [Zoogloeaceae bacterium]
MCTTCGCESNDAIRINGESMTHTHEHTHEHEHAHGHTHEHEHAHEHTHGHEHARGHDATRRIAIEADILARNDAHALENRKRFMEAACLALNLVSSPGSGKTALLVRTLAALKDELPLAVIEGDQETQFDADRIRAAGVPALQINTGKGCHLDARMVERALEKLPPPEGGILFIENVGNLVCPAAFDLGEAAKVAILSVTEGEDKPLKYPDMFHAARLMLINKIDLLPHVDFDAEKAQTHARRLNPQLQGFLLSAASGEGFDRWIDWLRAQSAQIKAARIRQLETQLALLKG